MHSRLEKPWILVYPLTSVTCIDI